MPEPGRLSPAQLLLLLTTALTIWGHMVMVRVTIIYAGRDAWIAGLAGGAAALPLVALIGLWVARWPGTNLFALIQQRLKWVGLPISVGYLAYFFLSACLTGRMFGLGFALLMPDTPSQAVVSLLLGLSSYALLTGLEPFARTVQILLAVLIAAAWVFLVPPALKDIDFRHILPIMAAGPLPVLRGALVVLTWLSDLTLILMLHPTVRKFRAPWGYTFLTLAGVIAMILGPLMGPPLVFGPEEAARMTLPTFDQIRYMRMGTFIENLDGLAVLLWTVGLYARLTLFHYLLVLGTAQVMRVRDYRALVVPMGVLIGVGTATVTRNHLETYYYLVHTAPVLNLFFGLALPALLLLAGLLLGWRENPTPTKKGASS